MSCWCLLSCVLQRITNPKKGRFWASLFWVRAFFVSGLGIRRWGSGYWDMDLDFMGATACG